MLDRIAAKAGLAATIIVSTLLLPATALAARQAICEHPEGGYCVAKGDTGRIECQCADGVHELRNDEIVGANDTDLMRACWDAWTMSCAPWKLTAECDDPELGSCEIDASGKSVCDCLAGTEVEEEVEELRGLTEEELELECQVQIERTCEPPAPDPVMGPAPVAPPVEADPVAQGCAFDRDGAAPAGAWALVLLGAAGIGRRRRR